MKVYIKAKLTSLKGQVRKYVMVQCALRKSKTDTNCFCLLSEGRDGAVVRALVSHQCGSGSIPGLGFIRGLSLLLRPV